MMPLILVSHENRQTKQYLNKLKNTGDIFFMVTPKTKEFSLNEIKELIREAGLSHKEKRVYILSDFQNSSLEAQNAMLKMLEEPPANTQFVMVVENPNQIIPTIISRSKIVFLSRKILPGINFKIQNNLEDLIKNKELKLINFDSDDAINQMLIFFRQRLVKDPVATKIIKEIIAVTSLMEKNNLNKQLAVDHLLIFIQKAYTMKS